MNRMVKNVLIVLGVIVGALAFVTIFPGALQSSGERLVTESQPLIGLVISILILAFAWKLVLKLVKDIFKV